VNPWLVFVLTCLCMAAVLAIIGLIWTEGFARLCIWRMPAHPPPGR